MADNKYVKQYGAAAYSASAAQGIIQDRLVKKHNYM